MNKITIEIADAKDLNQILALYVTTNHQVHAFLSKEVIEQSTNLILDEYFEHWTTIIIRENKQIIAFLSLIDNEISDLYVDANYQKLGYGRTLLNYAINHYGCDTVRVFAKNINAYNFYLSANFKQIEEGYDDDFKADYYTMTLNN